MSDPELLERVKSLQYVFKQQTEKKGEVDFGSEADALGSVADDIEKQDYFDAQEKLEKIRRDFAGAAYSLGYKIKEAGIFSDKKAALKDEAEDTKRYESEINSILYRIGDAAKEHAQAHATNDTDMLLAAAESLKRGISYESRYSDASNIADYLLIAAKNQQHQAQVIKDQAKAMEEQTKAMQAMSEKIDKLEQRLAEIEDPKPLDKPKMHPPGLNG